MSSNWVEGTWIEDMKSSSTIYEHVTNHIRRGAKEELGKMKERRNHKIDIVMEY